MTPPVKLKPLEDDNPAVETPPLKVDVALEFVTAILEVVAEVKAVEEARKVPVGPMVRLPTTVEEEFEMKPEFSVVRSATRKVLAMEEEAVPTKPL